MALVAARGQKARLCENLGLPGNVAHCNSPPLAAQVMETQRFGPAMSKERGST